jgi:hypothetical protein
MRGYYSAAYLNELVHLSANRFDSKNFKLADQFQMIVGTSTGAIIGAGLSVGMSPEQIMSFYSAHGENIFPKQLPSKPLGFLWHRRKRLNKLGEAALRKGLIDAFGEITLGEAYKNNKVALVIPAVDATTHRGWVFKTPHNKDSNHRDDNYSLVDVCLATSAAPIYRSLASIKKPGKSTTKDMFVDGGLWANNPVLVALSEALRLAKPDQSIEVFCLGTSPEIAGAALDSSKPHWGLLDWRFGGHALELSLDAQSGVFDYLAKSFCEHLNRPVNIIRFPQRKPSSSQSKLLGLDCARKESLDLMRQLASGAADDTNRLITSHSDDGRRIAKLLGTPFNKQDVNPSTKQAGGEYV